MDVCDGLFDGDSLNGINLYLQDFKYYMLTDQLNELINQLNTEEEAYATINNINSQEVGDLRTALIINRMQIEF